jgi:hypothetical protein
MLVGSSTIHTCTDYSYIIKLEEDFMIKAKIRHKKAQKRSRFKLKNDVIALPHDLGKFNESCIFTRTSSNRALLFGSCANSFKIIVITVSKKYQYIIHQRLL